jgi:hypothetical protein
MTSPGIAPAVLLDQVTNTAAWALEESFFGEHTFGAILRDAPKSLEGGWPESASSVLYLRLLLAAHYTTVATFVPTDVDARIRHHFWQAIEDPLVLEAAVDAVDEAAAWPSPLVSARSIGIGDLGPLSGHDGEWLSVRAGALGRALAQGAVGQVERLASRIDAELDREANALRAALASRDPVLALSCVTIVAHNLGDLSRVVEAWPKGERFDRFRTRYARLGHDDPSRYGGVFVRGGAINKAVMAIENHRFLPLRAPRALRRSRDLLLPIGPFFDAWGERVARHAGLEQRDHAEIILAWVEVLERGPDQQGALRALAGMERGLRGGLDAALAELPARKRRLPHAVREALRIDERRFEARMKNRLDQAMATVSPRPESPRR